MQIQSGLNLLPKPVKVRLIIFDQWQTLSEFDASNSVDSVGSTLILIPLFMLKGPPGLHHSRENLRHFGLMFLHLLLLFK